MEAILKAAQQSGSLNLSNRKLTTVPDAVWNIAEQNFGGNWWEVIELKKLDLSHNQLARLSPAINKLSDLQVLLLSYNSLTDVFFPEFFQLAALNKLDLSHNLIRHIPEGEEWSNFASLDTLNLSHNKLSGMLSPSMFIGLAKVTHLDLSNNQITALPQEIGQLKNLRFLNVSHNLLTALPSTISQLSGLTDFEANANKISKPPRFDNKMLKRIDLRENHLEFPPEITKTTPINELYIGFNRIKVLPCKPGTDHIFQLQSLNTLDVRDNNLDEIPAQIADLKELVTLDVRNNNLVNLPAELALVPKLTRLNLEGNPLKAIRRTIQEQGTLSILKYLKTRLSTDPSLGPADAPSASSTTNGSSAGRGSFTNTSGVNWDVYIRDGNSSGKVVLTNMKLTHSAIPPEFWDEQSGILNENLIHLDLTQNALTEIPPELLSSQAIISLRFVSFARNKLQSLPQRLFAYSPLTELVISYNMGITALPESLPPTLQKLDARGCRINAIPASIRQCTKLRILLLGQNQFRGTLPREVIALESTLEHLDFSSNQLTDLPDEFINSEKMQQKLEMLDLGNNNIAHLQPQLGNFRAIRHMNLEGNPLKTVRRAILEKGTPAVLEYLRSRIPLQ